MDENALAARKAIKVHWEKRMHDGSISASEYKAYSDCCKEIALMECEVASKKAPKPNLPAFDDDSYDDPVIPFRKAT
jgi:hypothetical protein